MKFRLFVRLFAFVVVIALIWMSPIAPVSTTIFAQQQGAQGRFTTNSPTGKITSLGLIPGLIGNGRRFYPSS